MTPRFSKKLVAAPLLFILVALAPARAAAEQRVIVRTAPVLGLTPSAVIGLVCGLLGCTVKYGLDDPLGRLFLVTIPDTINLQFFITLIESLLSIDAAEADQAVSATGGGDGNTREVPPALVDGTPIQYYGTTVRRGYVQQPATQIVELQAAQTEFGKTGRDVVVAVIDTGIDPNHPLLS
ncbi:MAG: hypothetical protein ACRD2A_23535, partial [Vicinamibacterales bacterium]